MIQQEISAIQNYEKSNIPASIYVHSWELTPEFIPKVHLPFKENFITYHNIKSTYSKIEKLLNKFTFSSFERYMNISN